MTYVNRTLCPHKSLVVYSCYAALCNTFYLAEYKNVQFFSYIHIKIYTALRHRTYNQAVKVSACEGIDMYT